MEFGVIRYWLKESNFLLIIMYATWILMGAIIMSFEKDSNFIMSGIMGFCPIFSSIFIGNKVRTYSSFGFSRKQYFKNIIVFNAILATELVVISMVIIKIMLVVYADRMTGAESLESHSLLGQFIVMFLLFDFCYATIFFDSAGKMPVISNLFGESGIFNQKSKRTEISFVRKIGFVVCYFFWFMGLAAMIEFYNGNIKVETGSLIISGSQVVYLVTLVVLTSLVYYFGFRRLRKKEYV